MCNKKKNSNRKISIRRNTKKKVERGFYRYGYRF